jgi:hypothetical protein
MLVAAGRRAPLLLLSARFCRVRALPDLLGRAGSLLVHAIGDATVMT